VTEARRIVVGALLATVGLIVLLGMKPVSRTTLLAGYAIVLAAIALAALMRIMRAARSDAPSRFAHELAREEIPPSRPNALVRIERELTLAMSNAGNVHDRFRPLIRDIAEARECTDDELRAFLAEPEPRDRSAPGLSARAIRRLVDTLERA
jgi:hypothetical protein